MTELRTARLLLRPWREKDRDPFAALNADPEVMRWLPATSTREQSDAFVDRQRTLHRERGWGFWAVEAGGGFIGFVGLDEPRGRGA